MPLELLHSELLGNAFEDLRAETVLGEGEDGDVDLASGLGVEWVESSNLNPKYNNKIKKDSIQVHTLELAAKRSLSFPPSRATSSLPLPPPVSPLT